MKSLTRKISHLFAIFILAFIVRAAPLGRYITPDEPIWVLRSVHFADAIASRQWRDIPQTGHPGLTTMVLGAIGARVTQVFYPNIAEEHLAWIRNMAWLSPENDDAFPHLAFFLPISRTLMIGIISLGIMLIYSVARPRLGEKSARLLVLFLALDPFFAGLSGLLHTDALQAMFVILAVLFILPYPKPERFTLDSGAQTGRGAKWLRISSLCTVVIAALCLALAGLSKTLGLLIAPGMALSLLLDTREPWFKRVLRVTLFAVMTMVFIFALYPPFWHDPVNTFRSLINAAGYHEGIGLRDTFFLGEMTSDAGPLFYPLVLFFRLTPPVLVGLAFAVYAAVTCHRTNFTARLRWFVLPIVAYLVVLSIAAKKFDRYALSVVLLLTPVAALTLRKHISRWRWPLLMALLFPWVMVAPLPLYYADPLVGGPWLARHIIPLGWGEASGIVATCADRVLSAPGTRTLMAENVPGAAAFFSGDTRMWDDALIPCVDILVGDAGNLGSHDVAVHRLHIAGMDLTTWSHQTTPFPISGLVLLSGPVPGVSPDAVAPRADIETVAAWLAERFPVGETFTRVHTPVCYPLAEKQLGDILDAMIDQNALVCVPGETVNRLQTERCTVTAPWRSSVLYQARFAGGLDLLASAWPAFAQAPEALTVRLRWQAQAVYDDFDVYLALWDHDETVLWVSGGGLLVDDRVWRTSAWEVGRVVDGEAHIPLPVHLPPGVYTLVLSLSDGAGHQAGLTLADGTFGGTQLSLGEVSIVAPSYSASALDLALITPVTFPGLRLIAADPPPHVHWAGDKLPFSLGWERVSGDPSAILHWTIFCVGEVRSSGDLPLAPGNPATWPEGYRYITHYAPRTASQLADGPCELRVQAGDGGTPARIGTVDVRARERNFVLPHTPQIPLTVTVGNFATLVGADISVDKSASVSPGDTVEVTIYWRAQSAADLDYTTFVHFSDLAALNRRTWTQSDGWPDYGVAPTTSWIKDQVIVDRHTLNIPADIPSGAYDLRVGLYDADGGGRVPLYNEQGERLLDDEQRISKLSVVSK